MILYQRSSVTNSKYAPPGITFLSLKSDNLRGRGEVSVYIPELCRGANNVPVVILLHGVYGSFFSWLFQAGAHLILEQLIQDKKVSPLILAMPSDGLSGDGTGYFEHADGRNYEKWITEDVPEALGFYFPEIGSRSGFFISGLSMGGYGALRLGIKYPKIFRAISAHSAITNLNDWQSFVEEDCPALLHENTLKESEVIDLAILNKKQLPPIRFDCGLEDRLLVSNRTLHQQLTEAGIDHIYEEFPGAHQYEYWTEHLVESLIFFSELQLTGRGH